MTPQARLQASIEILDLVIDAAKTNGAAADTIIASWFKTRRFAGSGDRRAVRELVYRAIRAFGTRPHSGRAAFLGLGKDLRPLFDGTPYAPAGVDPKEAVAGPSPLSAWLAGLIDATEHKALLDRAPLDLRVNALRAERDSVLALFAGAVPVGRDGIRLADNVNIEQHAAFGEGLVDIQDAGSQLIAQVCAAQPGMRVVDLCAGAGGKSLALAADMRNQGQIIATDTNRDRLQRLPLRAERMGISIVETRLLNPGEERDDLTDCKVESDVVLVDAPCSGSGTWRRNPEARWRLTPSRLAQVCETQAHVLELGASLVRPGGALVYGVCSLIDREGPDHIAAFLAKHKRGWTAEPIRADMGTVHGNGLRLSPAHDGCDGFFIARLARSG